MKHFLKHFDIGERHTIEREYIYFVTLQKPNVPTFLLNVKSVWG